MRRGDGIAPRRVERWGWCGSLFREIPPTEIQRTPGDSANVVKFHSYRGLGGNNIIAHYHTGAENGDVENATDAIVKIRAKFDKASGAIRKARLVISISAPL